VELEVDAPATAKTLLNALEADYPVLRGTIRDYGTLNRRAYLRYFACGKDVSFESPDAELPDAIVSGAEPFMIIGAIAGG
jgi:hypothetical protein